MPVITPFISIFAGLGRSRRLAFLLLMALVFLSPSTQAGTNDDLFSMDLEELLNVPLSVVSSHNDTVFDTPFTVSVITQKMIQRYNFQTVAEAINTLAGISVLRTGSRTNIPTGRWVLQDHYPNKVLVMINGVPSWEATTGATTLAHVSPSDLKRIEVLKGPASVLYGSNAYVAAINLVLDDNSPDEQYAGGTLYGGAGSYGAVRSGGHYLVKDGQLSVFLAANNYDENGSTETLTDAAGVTGNYTDFQNYNNVTLSGKYGHHSLLFNSYHERQAKLGIDPLFAAALGKPHQLYGYLVDYHYDTEIGAATQLKAGVSYDVNNRRFPRAAAVAAAASEYPSGIPADEDLVTDVDGYRLSGYARLATELARGWNLDAGLDAEMRKSLEYRSYYFSNGEVSANNNLSGREVNEYSAFAQLQYRRAASTYLLGSRATENELAGFNLSSRAGWVYRLAQDSSIKLNVGQSFRAPALFELYFQNNGKTLNGNQALKPETSTTYEFAYVTRFRQLYLQALIYHAVYHDKIFRKLYLASTSPNLILMDGTRLADTGLASTTVYTNGNSFSANGLELEAKLQYPYGGVFANYSYVNGNQIGNQGNDNFIYPPKHKLALGINLNRGGFFGSAVLTGYSQMHSVVGRIESQCWLDMSVGYQHQLAHRRIRHTLSVKNVTDRNVIGPDYVDRNPNFPTLPWVQGRRIDYTLQIDI